MLTLLILIFLQCLFLVGTQVLMKITFNIWGDITWGWDFIKTAATTWQFAAAGLCAAAAAFLWVVTMRRYPFSLAYTLQSFSYVIGLLAARFILGETIPLTRWLGVALVLIGVFFIVLK